MTPTIPHTSWLITGASSGLGAALALDVLHTMPGAKVIGTTRSIARARTAQPEFGELGGIWLEVDVASPENTCEALVRKAVEEHEVDVLVNCAGVALLGALEDISDEEIRMQLETNLMGPLRCIRAALPPFRARHHQQQQQQSGSPTTSSTIVNVGSAAGFIGRPGRSLYSASKFALEGATESLAHEVRPLGVRVLLVEPGGFRTPFASGCVVAKRGLANDVDDDDDNRGGEKTSGNSGAGNYEGNVVSPPYRNTPAEHLVRYTINMDKTPGALRGDPAKAARRIVEVVTGTGMAAGLGDVEGDVVPLRLLLGTDCTDVFEKKMDSLKRNYEAVEAIAKSTDVDGFVG